MTEQKMDLNSATLEENESTALGLEQIEETKIEETTKMDPTIPEPTPVEPAPVSFTPSAEPKTEPHTPPPSQAPPRTFSNWFDYIKLATTALIGALFGAFLALLVIGGINGTLDFGQTEAVVSNQVTLNNLGAQAEMLQSDIDGLRQRLDHLEGLTARMDGVEQAVDDLDIVLLQAQDDVDTLNARTNQLNEDIATVRASADRFDLFLNGLRDLLFESQDTPSTQIPTPTPFPTASPRPTRTPRPTPTVAP